MNVRRPSLLLLAVLAGACSESSPTGAEDASTSGTTQCTTDGQVGFVRSTLRDWYYWYRELPDPAAASFGSPEAYLEAVRYRPVDTTYSYLTSKSSSDAFFSNSQFIGFGLSYKRTGESELRLTQTYPDSPASEAGLERGDRLLSINGRSAAELLRSGEISTVFGPEQLGVTAEIAWRDRQGAQRSATLAKRSVTIPTVSQTAVIGAVGYVHFRNFVQPSNAALDTAFTQLREAGASELVLDLRYNGGGLVSVAQHLASLVAGPRLAGRTFIQFTHNDKQSSRDTDYELEDLPQALGVTRLVVIASRSSASASEAVINGLRPHMTVQVVGDTSYGKPVGQYGFDFCDRVLYPVAFLVTNASGQADYFDGIAADCAAPDDLDHALASEQEASLAEALHLVRTGNCSGLAAAELRARAHTTFGELRATGWQSVLNAW